MIVAKENLGTRSLCEGGRAKYDAMVLRVREKYGASSLRDSSLWIKYHSDEYIKGEFLMDSKMEMTCTNQ